MNKPVHQYALYNAITTSTLIYTGPGTAHAIIVSSHTNGTIKLWDNISAATTILVDTYTYPAGSSVIPLYGVKFLTGLFVDTNSTTQKITVAWNPYLGG